MDYLAPYLPHLLLAWSIQFVGVISPGPSVALILGVAVRDGRTPALAVAGGIASASLVLAVATVLGLAALFAQGAGAMTLVRIIGGLYLLFLAYRAFRRAITLPPLDLGSNDQGSVPRLILAGFLLQLTNPKTLFFWMAVAATGGVGDAPLPVIAVFVLGAFVNSFLGHGTYALMLSAAPFRAGYMAARRWIDTCLGGFFAYAGYRLMMEND